MKFIQLSLILSLVALSKSFSIEGSDLKWIQWNSKSEDMPEKSVQGGLNPEGRSLYVMRVKGADFGDENEFVYGTCGAEDGKSKDDCFVSFDSGEKQVFDVEILTGENFAWCPKSDSDLADNHFICKSSNRPGCFETGTLLSTGKCRFGALVDGKAQVILKDDYQVLKAGSC